MGKQWKQWQTLFLGSKVTADGDCSHEIKRYLFLGRKAVTNLDSILKSRDITDKGLSSQSYTFSSQFSRSVVSNSLWPYESKHARPPCHHQLPEFIQTHIHRVSDAIHPSHPLSSPSPPAPNPSQSYYMPLFCCNYGNPLDLAINKIYSLIHGNSEHGFDQQLWLNCVGRLGGGHRNAAVSFYHKELAIGKV